MKPVGDSITYFLVGNGFTEVERTLYYINDNDHLYDIHSIMKEFLLNPLYNRGGMKFKMIQISPKKLGDFENYYYIVLIEKINQK